MNIQKDKLMHFGVNVAATIASIILYLIHPSLLLPALAIGLSLGKEYGDSKAIGNYWDWYDIVADGMGIVIVLIPYLLIRLFL